VCFYLSLFCRCCSDRLDFIFESLFAICSLFRYTLVLQGFPLTLSRQTHTTRAFADSRIRLLCHALHIRVAHVPPESCPSFLSFPRKNAELTKKFCTRLIRQANQCTAAVFQPTWRTPRVHHKKGRPRAATSHESRPGKPSFCTSSARTRLIVRSGTDNSIEQRAWRALRTLS